MNQVIPCHVAIIMDGNGRWAQGHNKPRSYGHYIGTQRVRDIAIAANNAGVKYLTLFAFSTENWIRSKEEVDYLMSIPAKFFSAYLKELMANNIKVTSIGEMDKFPDDTRKVLLSAIDKTVNNTGMVLCFAMNYGSRREITLAVKEIIKEKIPVDQIDETTIQKHLMTADMPDVDFLIRTSGECRISNFLLWQISYAEMYFPEISWPDFQPVEFEKALDVFASRQRRYGGTAK